MASTQKLEFVDGGRFKRLNPFLLASKSTPVMDRDRVDTIVLHWTAGSTLSGALGRLKENRYGYHFFIGRDGTIIQGAETDKGMNHAGISFGPQGLWVKQYSISISFIMTGQEGEGREFNTLQFEATKNLILNLKLAYPQLKWITGHHWIAPRRKIDPFTFPFEQLTSELNSALDSSGVSNNRSDAPRFEIWRTGDGINGDESNQEGLTKKGSYLTRVVSGTEYRFDRGALTGEIANFEEVSPSLADVDDFTLSYDGDNPPSVNGFKKVNHASDKQKTDSFGQVSNFS